MITETGDHPLVDDTKGNKEKYNQGNNKLKTLLQLFNLKEGRVQKNEYKKKL